MSQVRFHGRGGQGLVTSAELLATAALLDGRHAQALAPAGAYAYAIDMEPEEE